MKQRSVEVKCDNEWLSREGIHKLRKGQKFRMFEPDGEPVVGINDKTEFLAISEPYWSDIKETWMIDIDTTEYSDIVN